MNDNVKLDRETTILVNRQQKKTVIDKGLENIKNIQRLEKGSVSVNVCSNIIRV